jgi:hypothetical protein
MPRRVMAPAKTRATDTSAPAEKAKAVTSSPQGDSYLARLVKYIPSEIIAVYVLVNGFIVSGRASGSGFFNLSDQQYFGVFAIFLVVTPIYTFFATNKKGLPAATGQIFISIVSFAAWAFSLGGPFTTLAIYKTNGPMISAIALPVVVLAAGFFVPKPQQV